MNKFNISDKNLFYFIQLLSIITTLIIGFVGFLISKQSIVMIITFSLVICNIFWMFCLVGILSKKLSIFTSDICDLIDNIVNGKYNPANIKDEDTLFSKINHHLSRLYLIVEQNKNRLDKERNELQSLISDISHQVKTPISNLKMVTETMLTVPISDDDKVEFLNGIQTETDKLDFLINALVKTSRLETGIIHFKKVKNRIYDTIAQAMSGIIYSAEKKNIFVSVECPNDLFLYFDSKWTSEAIFNILDNAIKYTQPGGKISVSVEKHEMYAEIKIADNGKGISESNQATIFKRFYREENVHDQPGVGIGLYLSREIISKQGGYIKVNSKVDKGSIFSIMLPVRQ